MPVWSDMNGFPEGGFPVLADDGDRICLGQVNLNPLKSDGYIMNILGNVKLGAMTITQAGAVAGITSLGIGGALSGATTIGANNTVTLSHATAPLVLSGANASLSMTGIDSSIGSVLTKIRKGFFKMLFLDERPMVGEDTVALVSDVRKALSTMADGTYTVGIGGSTNGTVTITNGVITAIQQAT